MIRLLTGVRTLRTMFALWLSAALLLLSGFASVPARAAGSVTETGWIPLGCNINGNKDANGNYTAGIAAHIGTALKVTHDQTLTPGQTFHLTGVSAFQIVPPAAQEAGYASFGNGDAFAGVVTQFMNTLIPFTMLDASLSTAAPITSLTVKPILEPLASGSTVHLHTANAANAYQNQDFVLSAPAAFLATTLSVVSQTPNFAYLKNNTQVTSTAFTATATSNFSPGSTNGGALIDQVQALQPPNTDALPGGTRIAPGAGGTSTTLTAGIANGAVGVTTLSVNPLPAAIKKFSAVTLNPSGVTGTSSQSQTLSADALAGATTLNVQAFTSLTAYPAGTAVTAPDDKAYVSPDASDPAPGQIWSDNLVDGPAGVYTFGPIPIAGLPNPQPLAFGPAPGVGGGVDPNLANDGTPKPTGALTVGTLGPSSTFTVTGSPGQNVILLPGDTGHFVNNGAGNGGPLVATATVGFHNPTSGTYGPTFPVACGLEANNAAASANQNPNPCTAPGVPANCYVSAFIIPIVQPSVVPEAPFAIMLPLAGVLVVLTFLAFRRRQEISSEQS